MTTSREYGWRAARALEVYLERGQAALTCLDEGEIDAATAILEKRQAAFYNFKALDAMARQAGENIATNSRVIAIYSALLELEPKLAKVIKDARDQALEQFRYVRSTRRKLNQGYGSSVTDGDTRFFQSV